MTPNLHSFIASPIKLSLHRNSCQAIQVSPNSTCLDTTCSKSRRGFAELRCGGATRVWWCVQQWNRRRLLLLKRSSRGPLRLVVISPSSGIAEQILHLNDYTYIAPVDPAVRPRTLAITFLSRPCFRFSMDSRKSIGFAFSCDDK